MVQENISQEFRLKNIDETRDYFLEEIRQNKLMSRKHKKTCTPLNYVEHFFILHFLSLLGIPTGITSSAIRLKICPIPAGINKYKSIIKKNKRKHDKIVLLAKSKLNSIKVLTSKPLIDSSVSHDEFVLINNVLTEYDDIKEGIKNSKT